MESCHLLSFLCPHGELPPAAFSLSTPKREPKAALEAVLSAACDHTSPQTGASPKSCPTNQPQELAGCHQEDLDTPTLSNWDTYCSCKGPGLGKMVLFSLSGR